MGLGDSAGRTSLPALLRPCPEAPGPRSTWNFSSPVGRCQRIPLGLKLPRTPKATPVPILQLVVV